MSFTSDATALLSLPIERVGVVIPNRTHQSIPLIRYITLLCTVQIPLRHQLNLSPPSRNPGFSGKSGVLWSICSVRVGWPDRWVSDSMPNCASWKYLSQRSFKMPEYGLAVQVGTIHLYRSAPKRRSWSLNHHACQHALPVSFSCQWSLIWRSTSTLPATMATYLTDSTCHLTEYP